MRFTIQAKQIAGVTAIVGVAVVALSGVYVTRLAGVVLHESSARGQMLSNAIIHRSRLVVPGSPDPYAALRTDSGLRSILESSIYGENVTGAAIVDTTGTIVASSDTARVGLRLPERADLAAVLEQRVLRQLRVIYSPEGQTLELRQPIILGDDAFGSIRIGVSTLLMRQELNALLRPALLTAAVSLGIAVIVAALLAQLLLRPIHVIRSGLTRLGKGEFGVTLDLPPGDEFGELGTFFNTISQQLSADRTLLAGQKAHLQSAVEHLEDAVALFNPSGELLFSNPAMQPMLPAGSIGRALRGLLADGHPYRQIVEETLAERRSRGPVQVKLDEDADTDHLLMTHAIEGTDHGLVGVLLVSRNIAYLSRMQSTIAYSRKLVALGRLTAGIAHEVKNPLNAMMIHLELLRTKIRKGALAVPQPEVVAVGGGNRAAIAPSRLGGGCARARPRDSRRKSAGSTRWCRASSSSRGRRTCASSPSAWRRSSRKSCRWSNPRLRRTRSRSRWTFPSRSAASTETPRCCVRRSSTWRSTRARRCPRAGRSGSCVRQPLATGWRCDSRTRASASHPSGSERSLTCTSQRRIMERGSVFRWSTASPRCTTAK